MAVPRGDSVVTEVGGLVLTARKVGYDGASLIVGHPGFPNIERALKLGDALLFETSDSGVIEIRVLRLDSAAVTILLTRVSPRSGIVAGFVEQDPSNSAFSPGELRQLSESLQRIRTEISQRSDVTPPQLDLISRKLDEMQDAASRLGRRDWMNLAIGTLTGIVVNAALGPEVGRALFRAADAALSWLFSGGLKLLTQ